MISSQFPIRPPPNYIGLIPEYIENARLFASAILGPLDDRWNFSHYWSEPPHGPMMKPKFDNYTYSVRLTERAMSDWWACMHEIGHEAVHALAPVRRTDDTNLEGGAACIMAVRYRRHITGNLVSGPTSGVYAEPFRLVSILLDEDPMIIARCRADGRRFRDISPQDLICEGASLSGRELDYLCSVF